MGRRRGKPSGQTLKSGYEARTDGRLVDKTGNKVHALVEIKPYSRVKGHGHVQMQEAAQMCVKRQRTVKD
mgnify:CR=1 FL=1